MTQQALAEFVAATAGEFDVPGVAVAVLADGRETFVSHGVRSIEDPLPVDEKSLFPVASISKSFTATALMRLASEGRVELSAPVRRYVPGLRLADERSAGRITVMNLLNHTAGLGWNLMDADAEDLSLPAFVDRMATLDVIAPPGTRASYSQAGFNLAGRVIEKVTGVPFERAVTSLVLEPLGMSGTCYDLDDAMAGRFARGHNRGEDGTMRAVRPWNVYRAGGRANNPGGGGLVSCASDLLRWARFHLGTGEGVLPVEALRSMRTQTVALRGSTLGDAFGICWFLRDVDGVRTVGHGGSGHGHFAELLLVPERDFAVVALANGGPDGYRFNQSVARWALEHHLGVVDRDPEPVPHDEARARAVAGRYEIGAMDLDIAADGSRLTLAVGIKPEIRAASGTEMPPDYPPAGLGFLPGDGAEYIITEGGLKGQRGFFTLDDDGTVTGVDLAGRLFGRVRETS
ncbi:serine hydrolase domain-containing protein [Streptomyces sp. NPDC048297]|uniref:serine hydrolase domain-containing protein n=1 Tax=Streptomyces sp. NPDC048297 TaxID=3365531 RepID=UPI003715C4D9